jgi:hypothetical protein
VNVIYEITEIFLFLKRYYERVSPEAVQCAHDVSTAERAIHLVLEQLGVAILIQPGGVGFRPEGVVAKTLSDTSLCFESCLIMRADDDSRLINEFAPQNPSVA